MHVTGDDTIADLAELFTVSRPTVYRTLERDPPFSWSPSIGMAATAVNATMGDKRTPMHTTAKDPCVRSSLH